MAVVHSTTLEPGKLELLTEWLPGRPWYAGDGRAPELARAGGFRLDDPAGAVGIEFMAVHDASGGRTYQVPMTYRGAPLDGAGDALIGTSEHGVLGRRWVYDGTRDPVLATQLLALVLGTAEPQAQRVSDTPDPSVTAVFTGPGGTEPAGDAEAADVREATVITIAAGGARLVVRLHRVLVPGDADPSALGHVSAPFTLPGGGTARGVYATVRAAAPGA